MFNFRIINKALTDVNLTDKEFRMLYLIVNNMSLNHTNSLEMFNGFLMDKLNLCERQVQRLTKSLEEKGYVTRSVESTSKNRNGVVFTLCDNVVDTTCDTECDKNVTPYNIQKNNIIYYNNNIMDQYNNKKNNNIIIMDQYIDNILGHKEKEKEIYKEEEKESEVGRTFDGSEKHLIEENKQEDNNDTPTDFEISLSETLSESVSTEEEKSIPSHWLVEPQDPLEDIWNEVAHTPSENTQKETLGDVFYSEVDNYQGNEEKSAQNALKVPQTESIDLDKVWTYMGSEHNGELMTFQECVERGLKYWCLQDIETKEFCTSKYLAVGVC